MRFISPSRDELPRLRTALTSGEWSVFRFFDALLPEEWEIYIQPHLNGLRPDFVFLHPRVGIAVYEIKDWDLAAMRYHVRFREGKAPELLATDASGKTFSLQHDNPIERVYRYKNEIYELYCPRLKQRTGLSAITAGTILTRARTKAARELLGPCYDYRKMGEKPDYHPIVGCDILNARDIAAAFLGSGWRTSRQMTPDLAKDLRNWLVEPDFAATQRQPLELDANQRQFVTTRTQSGYRRLKGPAGSGKSMVLAARASQLLAEHKTVLVVSFNITLLHYLMDIAVRWPHGTGNTRRDITWLNFHSWCKRVCEETDHYEGYRNLWKAHFESEQEMFDADIKDSPSLARLLSHDIPALVGRIIDQDRGRLVTKFDAILVDERQDFLPAWWNVLRKVCEPNGEMLLMADATQDIYGTARSWTDEAMTGAGFPGGRWATLSVSYRLPPEAADAARRFASTFLPRDLVDLPQNPQVELALYPCKMRWIQTTEEKATAVCVDAILEMPPLADPDILVIPDITFLAPSQALGLEVITQLGLRGIKTVHTFSQDKRESRRLKLGFYMGDARVKATTLHSFKGGETRGLVIYTGHRNTPKALALAYTGLTRIKCHADSSYITVVCAVPELAEYGKTWKDFSYR
jgi:hypothetical protein